MGEDDFLEAAYEDRWIADDDAFDDEADDDDDECEGHESLAGAHMGLTVYCNGSCRC